MTTTALKDLKINATTQDVRASEPPTEHQDTWLTKCESCLSLCPIAKIRKLFVFALNYSYDVLTILISIADVTTDIWVIYNYKIQNRNTFFIISLIIMILAQLSYSVAFAVRFLSDAWESMCKKLTIYFLLVLPLSPIMSFIFFILSFEGNWITRLFKWFGFEDDFDGSAYENQPPIIVWIEKKMRKHMGFIMEALIEALPQSIIQLIAIVYYQDTEIINIISICISLTSVATKTLVFSFAIDFRVFIFNWLSLLCDFFGIFAIVSWVFYNPENPGEITYLGQIWIGKAIIMWALACVLVGGFLCSILFADTVGDNLGYTHYSRVKKHGLCWVIMKSLQYLLGWFIIWILGSTFAILLCEVIFFAPFAFVMWIAAHERFVDPPASMYCKKIFDFILDNKSMVTKKGDEYLIHFRDPEWFEQNADCSNTIGDDNIDQWLGFREKRILKTSSKERLFRLVYANYFLGSNVCQYKYDRKLGQYLADESNISNGWKDVTLAKLRENCKNKEKAAFWKTFKLEWDSICDDWKTDWRNETRTLNRDCEDVWDLIWAAFKVFYLYFMTFFGLPLFVVSRLLSMFFPIISMVYLNFDLKSVSLLQLVFTVVYAILIISWMFALIKCMQFYYWSTHLFPGNDSSYWHGTLGIGISFRRLNLMQKYYNLRNDAIFIEKKRIETVIDILGKDVGGLIVSYWPQFEFSQLMKQLKDEEKNMNFRDR